LNLAPQRLLLSKSMTFERFACERLTMSGEMPPAPAYVALPPASARRP
jgi:hypothetical protein